MTKTELITVIMALVGWPLITGLLNWYLWWDTPEHWEEIKKTRPALAFFVHLNRIWGPHLRKLAEAYRDYAQAKSRLNAPAVKPPPPPP